MDLHSSIAIGAAKSSQEIKIITAESIILATKWVHSTKLWTQDAGFSDVPDVEYCKLIVGAAASGPITILLQLALKVNLGPSSYRIIA